jgi:hypothetical protein
LFAQNIIVPNGAAATTLKLQEFKVTNNQTIHPFTTHNDAAINLGKC